MGHIIPLRANGKMIKTGGNICFWCTKIPPATTLLGLLLAAADVTDTLLFSESCGRCSFESSLSGGFEEEFVRGAVGAGA
jgi:hypothetical protein